MAYPFTNQAIINNFGIKTFQKGVAYANEARVQGIEIQDFPNLMLIMSARVTGTGAVYETNVLFNYKNGNIKSSCSCPVGMDCKHSAALAYKCINQKRETLNPLLNWIKETKEEINTETTPNDKHETLIYRIYLNKKSGEHYVNIRIAKRQKNGKLSKGRVVDIYRFTTGYFNSATNAMNKEDEAIVNLLITSVGESYGNYAWIKDEIGWLAIKKLAKTNRFFYGDSEISLTLSPKSLEIEPQWTKKNGQSTFALLPAYQKFLFTQPLLVIDTRNGLIFEVENLTLGYNEIEMLSSMPPIDEETMQSSASMLLDVPIFENLPLPPELDISIIEDVMPTCHLKLRGNENAGEYYPFLTFEFKYDDYMVDALVSQKIKTIKSENKIIRIKRNLFAEQDAISQITSLGFELNARKKQIISPTTPDVATAIERWRNFLDVEIDNFLEKNWNIEIDDTFKLEFHEIDNIDATFSENNHWFDMQLDVEIAGKKVPLLPMLAGVLEQVENLEELPETLNLPMDEKGSYASINSKMISPIIKVILELYNGKSDAINLKSYDANAINVLEEALGEKLRINGGERLQKIAKKLKSFKEIEAITPPNGLKASLRDYQRDGLNWLNFLREFSFGGILADDMGLGKTVQTLAFLLYEKEQGRFNKPVLVIAPTSLMGNWRRESEKFTPSLKVLTHHGLERHQYSDEIKNNDIILTTYALAQRDKDKLSSIEWYYIILDEAQAIKNSKSKIVGSLKHYKATNRLCLTGTPMENHLGEMWSIYDFLMPGFLSSEKSFKEHYRNPIEKDANTEIKNVLTKRIHPFILRRKKGEVLNELPAKTEMIRSTTFGSAQAKLYETIRVTMEKKVRDMIAQKGMSKSHITMLDALLKLRQVCCDPRLLKMDEATKIGQSAKLDMAMELIKELLEEKRRILLFSQFTSMLKLIEEQLNAKKIKYTKLTGATRKRDEVIEKFQNGEVDIFLISLKAGGVGLNLTQADTVIHYDPWWNPAVENQATDRAHRIGQERRVFVYKLIIEGSVEEKILKLQEKKQSLQDAVLNGKSGVAGLSGEDIANLLT